VTRASWRSDECRGGQWSEGECVLAGGLGGCPVSVNRGL
jgi:hypothetical protein